MSRFYIIVLSLYLAFAPAYAYAINLSGIGKGIAKAASSKSGQLLVNAGSKYYKVVPQLTALGTLAWGFCNFYGNFSGDTCGDWARRSLDMLTEDGWTVENNENGIDIYKNYDGNLCKIIPFYLPADAENYLPNFNSALSYIDTHVNNFVSSKGFVIDSIYLDSINETNIELLNYIESLKDKNLNNPKFDGLISTYKSAGGSAGMFDNQGKSKGRYNFGVKFAYGYECKDSNSKDYITDDELFNYIQQNISDDDLTNIYNYNYTGMGDITINGNTYNGTEIDNSLAIENNYHTTSDSGEIGTGLEISPDVAVPITPVLLNPELDVGLPDINYNNCSADAEGVIINCDKLINNDNSSDNDGDEDNNEDTECQVGYVLSGGTCVALDDSDSEPWLCTTTDLTQKFCSWLDWTQEEPTKTVNTEVDIIEKSSDTIIDPTRYQFASSCPPAYNIPVNLMGNSRDITLDFTTMCEWLAKMKPFNVGAAYITSAFIITGIRPRQSQEA